MPRTEYENKVVYTNSAGQLHRDGDLPAWEHNNGGKQWWVEGQLHRIDNPAVIFLDGDEMWYLNGECYYPNPYYYPALYPYKGILF